MTDDIDTLAFLMCSLPEAEFSKIAKYLVNELDADARDLTSLFWKINDFDTKLGIKDQEDNCEENNGGELKEKLSIITKATKTLKTSRRGRSRI